MLHGVDVTQVNYNDAADGREDITWQEQGSDYNSDFSMPSDNDNDDEFDEKNESTYLAIC